MGHTSDSREVLVAELLGDFVKVLDRIDAVMPKLNAVCRKLEHTTDRLANGVRPFQERVATMALKQQDTAVAHITRHANDLARKTLVEQTAAMKESARAIFAEEVTPTLRRLAQELQQAAQRRQRWWDGWLLNLALVAASAVFTAILMSAWPLSAGAVSTSATAGVQSPGGAEQAPVSAVASQPEPPLKPERARARK